ncbi:MAG TPA: hypothetical protein VGM25_06350 [Caulobacteraceae bacterium]|jgi:hypothetical protein
MKKTLSLIAAGAALATLPALAHAQAHPDFTGAWQVATYSPSLKPVDGKPVPLKPEARKVYDQHVAAAAKGDRKWDETSICLPEGLPRIETIKEPFEIMQRDKAMYFVAQNRLPWRAYFGEKLPDDPDPMYLGYHVAKWEGAKLVIDSSGFRDSTVLDDSGIPHSEKLHLTATYELGADNKTMNVTYRIEDPDTFTAPWTARASFKRVQAGFQFPEEVCAEKLQSTAPKR